jgi:hypothetical protein
MAQTPSESLLAWFEKRPTTSELLKLIFATLVFLAIWIAGASIILAYIQPMHYEYEPNNVRPEYMDFVDRIAMDPLGMFTHVVMVAFQEELRFRFLPFTILLACIHIWGEGVKSLVVPTLVLFSIAFGIMHVNNYEQVSWYVIFASVLVQGVLGFCFGLIFFKYTGLQVRYVLGALVASTAIHVLWNMLLTVPRVVHMPIV